MKNNKHTDKTNTELFSAKYDDSFAFQNIHTHFPVIYKKYCGENVCNEL